MHFLNAAKYITLSAVGVTIFALTFFLIPVTAQGPEKPPDSGQVEVIGQPVEPVIINVDMNSLPPAQTSRPGQEIPRLTRPPLNPNVPPPAPVVDPLLKAQQNAVSYRRDRDFDTTLLNFEGFSESSPPHPPDTAGDVGPNHYIQMTNGGNTSVMIFDKSGTQLGSTFSLSSLWTAGGNCATGYGDPIVLYDRLADRWMLAEFAQNGNHLCIYISQTPDPTAGNWYGYDFTTPDFPDYPKYAVWGDAYYAGANEGPAVYAFDRQNMLAGNTARAMQRFTAPGLSGFGFQMLIPGDLDGATPPPTGAPAHFMRHHDTEAHGNCTDTGSQDCLEIWDFHVDWNTPANSTFARVQDIAVTEFDSDLCGLSSFNCFPQPGTTQTLDPLREVVMWRLQYRNFGDHESLVGNFVTDVDGSDHGGIRWFELRKAGANPWSLYQEGTYAPDLAHRWMGSIAMDGSGNIALAYSVSDAVSVYPSIRYAGRLASDSLNALPQGEHTIIAGGSSQTGVERWGDYNAMSVDPADDCTFWYTGEYMPASGEWHTRIAAFKFDACGSADFTLSAAPPAQEICAPNPADYTISVGQVQSYTDQVTLTLSGNPAGTSAVFATNPLAPATPPATTTLTISNTGAALAGSYAMNIVGLAATSTHTSTVQLNLFTAVPGGVTLNSPANNAINVSVTPTFSWTAATQGGGYLLEVATDGGFNSVVYSATVQGTSHTLASPLNTSAVYYWRLSPFNVCGAGSPSATYRFTTVAAPGDCGPGSTPNILFSDDFESGASGWSHTGTNDTWALSTARPNSGTYSYFAEDSASVSDQQLSSPTVLLPTDQDPLTLQFWNYQEIEDSGSGCYDGAILEISTDGGANWTQLETELLTDPYDGQISNSWGNPLGGLNGWCGAPQDWLNSVADVSAYAGQSVSFRFRLGTDSSLGHEGWYVDDVKVQACQPANQPKITLSKTVGLDPAVCAAGDHLVVDSGADVYYCYQVENTGSVTFSVHSLYDDQLGSLLAGYTHLLSPGQSYVLTRAATITANITNTAVWTAVLPGTMPLIASAQDSAYVEITHRGAALSPQQEQSAYAGETVSYTLQLTNTGNVTDSFSLSGSGVWTLTHPAAVNLLGPGEQAVFTAQVVIPASAAIGSADTALITATSQGDGSAADSARLITSVRAPTHTLTMAQVGSGVITPAIGTHDYTYGATVILHETPAAGWLFDGWSGDFMYGTGGLSLVIMDSDKAVTATFSAIPTYTLNFTTVGSGSVTLQPTGITSSMGYAVYYTGTVVTATASPAAGWAFGSWSGDITGSAVLPQTTVLMNANKAITATFVKGGYTVYLPVTLKQ